MIDDFKMIDPLDLSENTFEMIGNDWLLITAGNTEKYNTMTASWGGLGVMWNKKISIIGVRPQRYTYEFLEREKYFTLSVLGKEFKEALSFIGSNSGRNVDKALKTGITPIEDEPGKVFFKEARLVMVCKKLYFQDINPDNFEDKNILDFYPEKDYHRLYFAEIEKVLIKE